MHPILSNAAEYGSFRYGIDFFFFNLIKNNVFFFNDLFGLRGEREREREQGGIDLS